MHNNKLEIGPWQIDPSLNLIETGGRRFTLRPRTMDVLVYLAERPGQVISIDELLAHVWKGVVVGDNSVHHAISELRRVFAAAGTGELIETIPKRGYRLSSGSGEGVGEATGSLRSAGSGIRRGVPSRGFLALSVGIALLLVAAYFVAGMRGGDGGSAEQMPSVAVLAFTDLSPAGDQQYFADGIAVQIWNQLDRIDGLQVSGMTSVYYFKGRNEGLDAIRELLDVEYVLNGSVRKDGNELRITAELIDTSTGLLAWSKTYEEKFEDLLDIQDAIARSAAEAVGVKLGVAEWSPYPGMTRNADAFDEYLKGSRDGRQINVGVVLSSIEHLERAVGLDPDFGMAWVSLAMVYSGVALGVFDAPVPSAAERASHAIARARELNPDSPLVLEYLALMATAEGRWMEADELYQAAQRAAEEYFSGRHANVHYAEFLIRVGRINEAIAQLEKARAVSPLDRDVALMLVLAYGSAGAQEAALAELNRSTDLARSPRASAIQAGYRLIALGSRDRSVIARHWGEIPDTADGIDPLRINAWAKAYLDDPAKALEMLHRHAPALRETQAIPLATWANYFGDPELGLDSYRSVDSAVQIILAMHLWVPLYEDMRRLPGFTDLVADLGLVDYWRSSGQWSDFCRPVGDDQITCE